MNLLDFTLSEYDRLLGAAVESDWEVITVSEYLEFGAPSRPFVVVRHDVDRRVDNAITMAELEADHGVTSTYYFRTSTFEESVIRAVEGLGHEVGYHYEDLAKTRGDHEAARRRFALNLSAFREHVDVTTVCAHGSPLSPQQNLDLWRGDTDALGVYNLLGEAYLSIDVAPESDLYYLSDTGRTWHADLPRVGTVDTTADLIDVIRSDDSLGLYLLAHPCRWARSQLELAEFAAWDVSAEIAKSAINRVHALIS